MSNYIKPNVYIGNDLVWSEKHPRHGWSDRTLFKYQLALQECGNNLHNCYFEILNEGGWITYMRADSETIPDFSDEEGIKDSFYDSYVSAIKKHHKQSLTVEDWVKTLSPFGIKLKKTAKKYSLSSEYDNKNEWAIYEEKPTVPVIKSIMFDPEYNISEALMFLDIPNSLHPPLSGEANSPSPNWVINIYYQNNCVWSTKNWEYPSAGSNTWEEEAQRIKYIIENCCDQSYWIAHRIMLEIVTKDGPIYRNLDSFDAKPLNNGRGDDKISSWFDRVLEESWSYDDEDDCKTIIHQLENLGFIFCSGVLSHKKIGFIKDFGDKSFDDFYEITLPEIKAAIWEKKELRKALNSICITNPLHLPWSSYEGCF